MEYENTSDKEKADAEAYEKFLRKIDEDDRKPRNDAGRYKLHEAALVISENADEPKDIILELLAQDAKSRVLKIYRIGGQIEYDFKKLGTWNEDFYDAHWQDLCEIYWHELNEWLANNSPKVTWRFPPPIDVTVNSTTASAKKLIKNEKKWNDVALGGLFKESILPGVTNVFLAKKHGVSRQRISALLKQAKDRNRPKGPLSKKLKSIIE